MRRTTGRFSGYIRPFFYLLDLTIINVLAWFFLFQNSNIFLYHFFITISWLFISWNIDFYEVYRYTKVIEILSKIAKQYSLFIILNFAYLGYFMEFSEPSQMIKFVTVSLFLIAIAKLFVYYFLRRFRVIFGGNYRRVVIVGKDKSTNQLVEFFQDHPDYGYKLLQTFDFKKNAGTSIDEVFNYVKKNSIDEIYCSLSSLGEGDITRFVDFTDNNLKVLKFLPNNKDILSKNLLVDYYGYIPILSQRIIPLDKTINYMMKRAFDVAFSLLVIIFILSWLVPIVGILIKFESKGPVFFKQKRNGLNSNEFNCFKFRSMHLNPIADLTQVTKNDPRITKVGAFLRKTSLDEMPQFFNVFLGDMSVVGPRPHMISETERFAKFVDKFMVRHFIKPGITGLAQTNGFRGEVETESDIVNRVRYDIYYIENWSILLDLKIIFQTIFNILKGEDKAY
ncbi:MAG: undecaprenyl-phosphate glucose phosphotransferase [Flavobacterium sp.]